MVNITRTDIVLRPNSARVLFRPFQFGDASRYMNIIARVLSLSEREVGRETETTLAEFKDRHQRLGQFYLRRYEQVKQYMPVAESTANSPGASTSVQSGSIAGAVASPSRQSHSERFTGAAPGLKISNHSISPLMGA